MMTAVKKYAELVVIIEKIWENQCYGAEYISC